MLLTTISDLLELTFYSLYRELTPLDCRLDDYASRTAPKRERAGVAVGAA